MTSAQVVITGIGLALPGVSGLADLNRDEPIRDAVPVDAKAIVGRRALRYRTRDTQLALCAAQLALGDAGLLGDGDTLTVDAPTVGVVASSNRGSIDTVCSVTSTIAANGVEATSALALPNASSNVVASSIAIKFGLRGPNLMVCNGPTSGLDAIHWAAVMIAGGRTDRVVVVGAETSNDYVARWTGTPVDQLLDGAVALIVERADAARARGAEVRAELGRFARRRGLEAAVRAVGGDDAGSTPAVWFVPEGTSDGTAVDGLAGVPRRDLSTVFGQASGALGVLQAAAALNWLGASPAGSALLTAGSDTDDAVAGLVLRPVGSRA